MHSNACRLKGICRNDAINLSISGVVYRKIYGVELHNPGPMFVIGIKGAPYETHFAENRKNWHIILDDLNIRLSGDSPGNAEIMVNNKIILLPLLSPVPEEQVYGWQNELHTIKSAMSNPVPENYLRAELGVANIFRFLLDRNIGNTSQSPASKLKGAIDADTRFTKSLEAMSVACGYSSDHLRILFYSQYQISPRDYRDRKRIDAAMGLMTNSTMTIKEISWYLGFKKESAFSTMFKRLTGTQPKIVIKKLRNTI